MSEAMPEQPPALAARSLRVLMLKRRLAVNGSQRSRQAVGIAVRNECANLARLCRVAEDGSRLGMDAFEAKQDLWDQSIYSELCAMSREQNLPIHSADAAFEARCASADPTSERSHPPEAKFLYDSNDLLQALRGICRTIEVAEIADGGATAPLRRSWRLLPLGLATPRVEQLRARFAQLHPSFPQVGVDDSADPTFRQSHEALGAKLIKLGDRALIEQYLRQGCSPALRPRLYKAILHGNAKRHSFEPNQSEPAARLPRAASNEPQLDTLAHHSNGAFPDQPVRSNGLHSAHGVEGYPADRRSYPFPRSQNAPLAGKNRASGSSRASRRSSRRSSKAPSSQRPPSAAAARRSALAHNTTIVDRLHALDLELIRNNDNYFVFEDLLRNILPKLFRDHMEWLRVHSRVVSRLEHIRAVPYYGFALQVAPLAYLFKREDDIVLALREMVARYWCQLNVLRNAHPDSELSLLPNLCALFEDLVAERAPQVVHHLIKLDLAPLEVAFPWLHLAFAGALPVDELLLLWDRILAFDSLHLLPVLAAAIFQYRTKSLLHTTTADQARALLSETTNLNVIALLQVFLFS